MNRRGLWLAVVQVFVAAWALLSLSGDARAQSACDPPGASASGAGSFNTPNAFVANAGKMRIRKSVTKLTPAEVKRLEHAYDLLRNLKPTDPRSYAAQANVHCFYCGASEEIHGGWNFLPWHRAYLYFHERILAGLLGDDSFALPYWDWPSEPKLPAAYTTGALLDARRAQGRNARTASLASVFPGPNGVQAAVMAALSQTTFFLFGGGLDPLTGVMVSGAIENSPHGPVHGWTGTPFVPATSTGGDDMGLLATAGKDPVFFAHHGNIDRLWNVWLATPSGQMNPTDAAFLNASWRFVDFDGKWVRISARDVLDNKTSLKYDYNDDPRLTARKLATLTRPSGPPVSIGRPSEPTGKTQPGGVVLATTGKLQAKPNVYKAALGDPGKQGTVEGTGHAKTSILRIQGIEVPHDRPETVRLFVGLPGANAQTPLRDPHFVGYLSTVAMTRAKAHRHGLLNVAVALKPALKQELEKGRELSVTLVPVDGEGRAARGVEVAFQKMWVSDLGGGGGPPTPGDCPKPETLEVGRFGQYQAGVDSLPPDELSRVRALGTRIAHSFDKGCQPITAVDLVGHADYDASRTRAFELDVSQKRAAAVRAELIRAIGPAHASKVKIAASGVGSKDLKFGRPSTMEQRIANRRVVITTKAR